MAHLPSDSSAYTIYPLPILKDKTLYHVPKTNYNLLPMIEASLAKSFTFFVFLVGSQIRTVKKSKDFFTSAPDEIIISKCVNILPLIYRKLITIMAIQ